MAHDVFISYSHKDKNIADAVCHKLEENGVRCWYAPRNIRPGAEWAAAIIDALEHSRVMVLIFTDSSNVSVQVAREVSSAVSAGTVILPLKCTPSEPSAGMKYYLATVHWMDAVDRETEEAIDDLCDCVKRILGEPPAAQKPVTVAPAAPSPVKEEKKSAKKRIVGIAAAAAVVIALILGIVFFGKDKPAETNTDTDTSSSSAAEPAASDVPSAAPADTTVPAEESAETADAPVPDENNDSPGAESYLYSISSYASDVYDQAVVLDKYFGEETEVITVPSVIDGLPVVSIGEKCFNELENVRQFILPDTLEHIGYRAFYGCSSLCSLNLPDSLISTDGWCFAHTGLTSFIAPPQFESLGYGSFYSCSDLSEVVLTAAVDSIGSDTFCYLADGCRVTIPNADAAIDIKAFREKENVVLIAPSGSPAETYAKAMKLHFEPYG